MKTYSSPEVVSVGRASDEVLGAKNSQEHDFENGSSLTYPPSVIDQDE